MGTKSKESETTRLKKRVNRERVNRCDLSSALLRVARAHALSLRAERRFVDALADAGSFVLPCSELMVGNESLPDEDDE